MSMRRTIALALVAAAVLVLGGFASWYAHEGYRLYVVKTGSMSPTYDPGDVVVDKPASAGFGPRDVITFRISAVGDLVTHRLTHIDKAGLLHTKGDNNKVPDAWSLQPEKIQGVVTGHVPNLGYLIVFMRQPAGIGGVMTSSLAIFLLWGLCFPAAASQPAPAREGAASQRKLQAVVRVPQQRRAEVSTWAMVPSPVQPEVLRIPPPRQPAPVPAAQPAAEPAPVAARAAVLTLPRIPGSRPPTD